ncbi:hypothetical protein [Streptomyces sp. OR43]|uniref:hypothetical protein n=1 Tax=Streptomyces sp. or43 TaxID=2478957 RepID=UPI0011CE6FDA|nr:hypothetical protein [Streptomyces sp. or43]TXS38459.1 hypothetical protein EAO72_35375 [Streptomyces sp. or43]
MSTHHPKHEPARDEEHPATAAGEVLHEAEQTETNLVDDDGERGGQDGEASDALSPNEDAQEDVRQRGA